MEIISKKYNGETTKYYRGNVIKKLLKLPEYQQQPNPNFIKNTTTGEYLHYNNILKITIIDQKGVKMKYISWAKVNKLLWNANEYREAMKKIKTYKIDFPIWRKRSKVEVVKLKSYDDIIVEYATSSRRKNTTLIFN